MKFEKKVLIIGYGSVSHCMLPLLFKHIEIPYENITLVDFEDKAAELKPFTDKGMKYFQERVTPENITQLFSKYVSAGGLIIDLAWNIDCTTILEWCHANKVLYVNTSVEEWDPCTDIRQMPIFEKTLYYRQMKIRKLMQSWQGTATTAVVDHGANPGLVSHFTKKGLIDIANKVISEPDVSEEEKSLLKKLVTENNFSQLAKTLGIKVIHISERDTQITKQPKKVNEFVGTWSIEGLREEGVAPAEMGWGTHEPVLPALAHQAPYGPKNQIFLAQKGINTWVRSWVPDTEILGMIIRHAESFSISDYLTVYNEKNEPVYRPTVHYAYMPCNDTITSLHELRCRNYVMQDNLRIMNDEIIAGEDILGVLLMGHRYNSWWVGSILSIEESRQLVPQQNATTIQVAIGIISAIMWMIEHPEQGVCIPDQLPHEYILKIAEPYLGKLASVQSDWTPLKNYQPFFPENKETVLNDQNIWAFDNFFFKD